MVIDAERGKFVAQVPIDQNVDGAVFDPLKLAFSSNGEGKVTVVQEVSATEFKAIQTIKNEVGPNYNNRSENTSYFCFNCIIWSKLKQQQRTRIQDQVYSRNIYDFGYGKYRTIHNLSLRK